MQQKHLFVMDPIERLTLKLDSSIRMAFAIKSKGAECFYTDSANMYWNSIEGEPGAKVQKIEFGRAEPESVFFSAQIEIAKLSSFKTIYMRKDPPFDMEYLSATWLLQEAAKKTRVVNDPRILQSINEKIAILDFPKYAAPAIVSSNAKQILEFIKSHCSGNAVVKPLDLFGGRGVEHVQLGKDLFRTDHETLRFIDEQTKGGKYYRIVQPFNEKIFEGEVRAFTCAGEPIAWALKVPAQGEFLANTRMGAVLKDYEPTSAENKMIREVAGILHKQGAVFVGFDLIGGKISEINVTSPRLLQGTSSLDPYQKIADWAV